MEQKMIKKCPQCKSKLGNIEFDVGYGVKVKSLHCEKCGFNITEKGALGSALGELRAQMAKEIKVIRVGEGLGIRLPNIIVKTFNLKRGNEILIKPEEDGIKLVV